jgi:hypothetical protein
MQNWRKGDICNYLRVCAEPSTTIYVTNTSKWLGLVSELPVLTYRGEGEAKDTQPAWQG